MATRKRTPNPALADLLDQARWTRTQLAQQVNRLGPQAGLQLTYDRTAVAHWIAGTPPKPEVRPLILEHSQLGSEGPSRMRRPGSSRLRPPEARARSTLWRN